MHLQSRMPSCVGRETLTSHVSSIASAQSLLHFHLRPLVVGGNILPSRCAPVTSSSSGSSSCPWNSWPASSVACYASSTRDGPETSSQGQRRAGKRSETDSNEGSTYRPSSGSSSSSRGSSWGERGRQERAPSRRRLFGGSEEGRSQTEEGARRHAKELVEKFGLPELKVWRRLLPAPTVALRSPHKPCWRMIESSGHMI